MGRDAQTEEKRKQDDATLQIIFEYVVNNFYPENVCRNQKANIRRQLEQIILRQSGQLYYRHQRGQHHEYGSVPFLCFYVNYSADRTFKC